MQHCCNPPYLIFCLLSWATCLFLFIGSQAKKKYLVSLEKTYKKVAVWGSVHLSGKDEQLSLQGVQAYLSNTKNLQPQPTTSKKQYRYADACQWITNNWELSICGSRLWDLEH